MADATDLKSVLVKSEVWVRIPSSAPLKGQSIERDSLGSASSLFANGHENATNASHRERNALALPNSDLPSFTPVFGIFKP